MLKFSQFLEESKIPDDIHAKISQYARDEYRGAAPDLPKEGEHHNDSAHDHVSMRVYDKFAKDHPEHIKHFRKIVKSALSDYLDKDEPKLSKVNDKKAERARVKANTLAQKSKIVKPEPQKYATRTVQRAFGKVRFKRPIQK